MLFFPDETAYTLSGGYVLVLNGNGGVLNQAPSSNPNTFLRSTDFTVEIDENGSAIIDGSVTIPRIQSSQMRSTYLNNTAEEREKWLSSLDTSLSSGGMMLERKLNSIDDP